MAELTPKQREAPSPHACLYEEDGSILSWLAATYALEDIRDEWDYLFENGENLREVWMCVRWTTPEELANEDTLFYLFGDFERTGVDTSVVYEGARRESPGAHRYWTRD